MGLSVQVLQEFYVQATHPRRSDALPYALAERLIQKWLRFRIQDNTVTVLQSALNLKQRFRYSSVATMNIALTKHFEELIARLVGSGRYNNSSEVVLNGADGLEWETLVKCDLMYLVEKERLYRRRGRVGTMQRRALVQRLNACFGFTLV